MRVPRVVAGAALLLSACGGSVPAPAGESPAASPAAQASPAVMPGGVSGWTLDGAVRGYGPGALWEYIDGGAEQYLAYGFETVTTARYRRASGAVATVDVYRMATSIGAFGLYVEERPPAPAPLELGVDSYAGSDAIRFWSGSHYVKLTVVPADAAAVDALQHLARDVASRLGDAGVRPRELDYLPDAGLVPGSVKIVPRNVLGQRFLSWAFQAEYTTGPAITTLLLLPMASPDAASTALTQYGAFLEGSGGAPVPAPGLGNAAWEATDGFYGRVLAARTGAFVLITLRAPDTRAARGLLSAALKRLPTS